MKAKVLAALLLVSGSLLPLGLQAQEVRGRYNPPPFQKSVASPSDIVRFMASDKGINVLKSSPNPNAPAMLKALGTAIGKDLSGPAPWPALPPLPPGQQVRSIKGRLGSTIGSTSSITGPITSTPCGTSTGSFFDNFEPAAGAVPQNEESIDFERNRISTLSGLRDLVVMGANDFRGVFGPLDGVTGFYVQRGVALCTDDFEGALPKVPDPHNPGFFIFGGGDPVVRADPARDAIFLADIRVSGFTTAIGVARTTGANLTSILTCPGGLEANSAIPGAASCWPTHTLVNALPNPFIQFFQDKPALAVDERLSGTGAGDVYVAGTEFDLAGFLSTSRIWLAACTNSLSACSSPILMGDASDTDTQFSDVRVRQDGRVTLSYINVVPGTALGQAFQIKYVECAQSGAPNSPACAPPTLLTTETQPLPFGGVLDAEDHRIATYPKHDHRVNTAVAGMPTETYLVWDRCKTASFFGTCVDADILMMVRNNTTGVWSATLPFNTGTDDQYFPWVHADRAQNVINVIYYDNGGDSLGFQHRDVVRVGQIFPCAITPCGVTQTATIQSSRNEPAGDPILGGVFFGDYIGVASRGSSAAAGSSTLHAGYTANFFLGSYFGNLAPQQDNFHDFVTY